MEAFWLRCPVLLCWERREIWVLPFPSVSGCMWSRTQTMPCTLPVRLAAGDGAEFENVVVGVVPECAWMGERSQQQPGGWWVPHPQGLRASWTKLPACQHGNPASQKTTGSSERKQNIFLNPQYHVSIFFNFNYVRQRRKYLSEHKCLNGKPGAAGSMIHCNYLRLCVNRPWNIWYSRVAWCHRDSCRVTQGKREKISPKIAKL